MNESVSTLTAAEIGDGERMRQVCHLCGSVLTVQFPEVPDSRTGEVFSVLKCDGCELGHTWPQPGDLSPYYRNYHGGRHGVTAKFCARRRSGFVLRATGVARGRKLLDVGCGEGTFLLVAKDAGWSVVGTELNPNAARAAGLEIFEDLEGASQRAPFDCITLWHSLEHMRDPQKTLQEVRALLSADGFLLIAVPNWGGWQACAFGRHWLHLDVPRHLYHFTAYALQQLLALAGFRPFRWWHQELEYDLLGWSQSMLNQILPRQNAFFETLTGKRPRMGIFPASANWVFGPLLTGLALPLVPMSALFRNGGTLVVAARTEESFSRPATRATT